MVVLEMHTVVHQENQRQSSSVVPVPQKGVQPVCGGEMKGAPCCSQLMGCCFCEEEEGCCLVP